MSNCDTLFAHTRVDAQKYLDAANPACSDLLYHGQQRTTGWHREEA